MQRTVPKIWASETLAAEAPKNTSETVSAWAEGTSRTQKFATKRHYFCLSRIVKKKSIKNGLQWRATTDSDDHYVFAVALP
jgi:hypothetical protein